MTYTRSSKVFAAACVVACVGAGLPAGGTSIAAEQERLSVSSSSLNGSAVAQADSAVFDIPPQPLRTALTAFAEQSGWQLFYSAEVAERIMSAGIAGSLGPDEALKALLSGTGLDFRLTAPRVVTLIQAQRTSLSSSAQDQVITPSELPREQGAPAKVKPVKLPEVVVKDVKDRGYVAESQNTATKGDAPLRETPQSITIITRDRMVAQEVNSVAEALRYTAGVQSETFGYEPRFTWLRFRGFDATTNGLFKDGLQLRNPGFAVSYNLEPYGAEQLDVLRGPASFLYGQGSPGGLLNYVSKRPTQESLHEMQFLTGNFGRYEGRFDFGGKLNDSETFSYRLTALFRESGTQIDHVPNDRVYIAPALTWRLSDDTKVTFFANYQKDRLGSSQALPAEGTLRGNPNGTIAANRFTGIPGVDKQDRKESSVGYELQHRLAQDWEFVQKLRYNSTELDGMTVYSNSLAADKRTINRFAYGSLGKLNALAIDNQVHGKFSTGPLQHALLGGLDVQRISVNVRQTFGAASSIDIFNRYDSGAPLTMPSVFLDQQTTQFQTGVYLQDQIKLYDKILLTVGGRHDWVSQDTQDYLTAFSSRQQNDHKATGRAALTYLFDNGLAPYVSYSTFFLPAFGLNPSAQAFKPETGRQYEAGIKYQPKGSRSYVTAALFDLTRENYVQTDPGSFLQVQRGKARSRGLELEGVASFDSGVDVIASYTVLDNEVRESANPVEKGKRLTQTPSQFGSMWVKYTVPDGSWKGLGIGGGARYTGSTYSDVGNTFKVPGFVVGDAVIDYLWGHYRLALNITNIFDHEQFSCFARSGTNFCTFGERRSIVGTVAYRW